MHNTQYIPEEKTEQIKQAAVLEDVVQDFVQMQKSGSSLVGDCPCCSGRKKLNVTPSKKIWKCFLCGEGGTDAVSFLMRTQGKDYVGALHYLADRYNISLQEEPKKKGKRIRKIKFRNAQLRDSGISVKHQKYYLSKKEGAKVECDRYQAATLDREWNVLPGDDMVLHYLDLQGKPMTFLDVKKRRRPLLRIRYANPGLHLDKDGNPVRYRSPYKSGSNLWLPNIMIEHYRLNTTLETLYITEGEKKADKMCIEGLPTVGIMGIHNFAIEGEMPYVFELLIKRCSVRRVVFVLDADWQDLSTKSGKPVDHRPKTFFKSVLNFRNYFRAYHTSGIDLDLFFAYGKDQVHKGMDDLLVRRLKGKEEQLKEDFEKAMIDRKGEGEFVNVHNITSLSDYKLKEYWYLHSTPAFLNHHREELKKIREFRLAGLLRRYNSESDEFELAQKLLPHEQYWKEFIGNDDKIKYYFSYVNILEFLSNRGFGLYEYQFEKYRFVHIEEKVVRETSAHKIQRYVLDFTRELNNMEVLDMLLRGGKQYLGPDRLSNMHYKEPLFMESEKDCQYLFFKNSYWKITADEVQQRPLTELPRHIWKDQIIKFEPTVLDQPMAAVERSKDGWKVSASEAMKKSDIACFYANTSAFHWKKEQCLEKLENGEFHWVERDKKEPVTKDDIQLWKANLVCKMVAAGYVLHTYRDYGRMKAIVCMDGVEMEVGRSQGGTGKSIWGQQFEYLMPIEVIDGKKKNIEDDNHLYENVDERTGAIVYDDVRVNFNFEFLFSQITTGTTVNPKGEKRYKILPPKYIVITNHALNGDGNSFDRRQYPISFSDYYNAHRTVGDEFGHQLFHEWDHDQWNYFYNWMANCIQVYLRYGFRFGIPREDIERRRQRQAIGENFMEWATLVFHTDVDEDGNRGIFLDKRVEKEFMYEKYLSKNPQERRYTSVKKFKGKLMKYAEYAGLTFNPTKQGGRIRSQSREFFILASTHFDAANIYTISTDTDLSKQDLPY